MNVINIIFITAVFVTAMFTASALCILAVGVVVAMLALESDVAYSNDHPLVKAQGLPL